MIFTYYYDTDHLYRWKDFVPYGFMFAKFKRDEIYEDIYVGY